MREAQKVQRGVRMELARLPQRGIGHDHRPHLGELNEQDVPRPADRRGRQADEVLYAGDESEEKHERDSDPVVDRPHQVRIQEACIFGQQDQVKSTSVAARSRQAVMLSWMRNLVGAPTAAA